MPMIKLHPHLSAAVDNLCSVSGKNSFLLFLFRNNLEMLSENFFQ